jgi:hypothetical protein
VLKLLDLKQAKLQWVHNPSQINGDSVNSVRHETSRYFSNRREEVSGNSKNKNIGDLYKTLYLICNSALSFIKVIVKLEDITFKYLFRL